MSYILDALKKADAEREQGSVPGLHSRHQAPAPGDDDEEEPAGRTLPIIWIGAGAALCLIAVLSWQLLKRDAAAPSVQAAAGNAAPPLTQTDAAVQGGVPAPAATQEAMQQATAPSPEAMAPPPTYAPQPVVQPQPPLAQAPMPHSPGNPSPAQRMAPPVATQSPAALPPPVAGASTRPYAAPAMPGNAQGAQGGSAQGITQGAAPQPGAQAPQQSAPHTTQQATQRLPQLHELPDHVRREIPQLTIGGAMYSEVPAQRMLIVNSQVFREGDQPYQGLVLEEIRLKSAVFSFRGQRYSVNY